MRYPIKSLVLLLGAAGLARSQLGLGDGTLDFSTSGFTLSLVKDSQTLYSLVSPDGFDYIPGDVMGNRSANGQYHVGDLTYRARLEGSNDWVEGDTAASRATVSALEVDGNTLAAANLGPTLGRNPLLNITRRWVQDGDSVQLLFDITNSQGSAVEIGALGAPLEFNSILTDKTADEVNTKCAFFDPYIGADAGYVQVTPLSGTDAPLVVIPVDSSPLEGWRFLEEDSSPWPYYQSQTFEGLYEWQFHTLAYAHNEWSSVDPWNAPTSLTLQPGESRTYGLRFLVAPSIRTINDALAAAAHPVLEGIPGYIISADATAKLFVRYGSPISRISVEPEGALSWEENGDAVGEGVVGYDLTVEGWGRARLEVTFEDGTLATVSYWLTKSAVQTIADMGEFLTTDAWFTDTSDPFGRAPSIITYDYEAKNIVLNDPRVWISGLSDEGGTVYLAAAMKQFMQPNADEVAKLEHFVAETVIGNIQNEDFSVKKSVFFYEPGAVDYNYPSNVDWAVWWSWNKADSYNVQRAYDYVHVAALHWALYRVARNYPDLVSVHTADWYLSQAASTVIRMSAGDVGYVDVGLMGETVYLYILEDLKRAGHANATAVENGMRSRQANWARQRYPFGSEQAWDSTGQEGVYVWSKYFNDSTTASNTIDSILGYQPSVPHWGYNGNARRYWDNIYGGKLQRFERQIHHYGSSLNALPLLFAYESDPSDYWLLRTAFGGLSGALSSINDAGFPAASFHSFADTLKWDGYTGDYGQSFSGHAMGMGTYILELPTYGWQAYGGVVTSRNGTIEVDVLDSSRRRVFVAPLGALFTADAGSFASVSFDPQALSVTLTLVDAVGNGASAPNARVGVTQTASVNGVGTLAPTTNATEDAGAYIVQFSGSTASITFA
ncbi:hypothetical protein FB107DRAFT_215289 [Schizophyllum commune]